MKRQDSTRITSSKVFIVLIFFHFTTAYSQLSSDFSPSNFEDTFKNLQKVVSAYREHDQARAALSNTSDLERIVKIMSTANSRYLATIESPRNPILRTYMALAYFYLGYAKGLVGSAEDALNYFDKAIENDADILYFQTEIGNRDGMVQDFINEYKNQLTSFAAPVTLEIRTYKFGETIDPSKIKFISLSQGKKENLPSSQFYLLFWLENFWRQKEGFWKEGDTSKIYFPNGRFKLNSLTASVQEIEFDVPTTKRIIIKPRHWFQLDLPEKAKLGENFKIFRTEDHGGETEITDPGNLKFFYFGHYRFKIKGKNFGCIPANVNFTIQGFSYRDANHTNEKRIPVEDNGVYQFIPCK